MPRVAWVTPRITSTKIAVSTISTVIAAPSPNPPGEWSPKPLLAKPPSCAVASQPSGPKSPTSTITLVASAPPTTCAMR